MLEIRWSAPSNIKQENSWSSDLDQVIADWLGDRCVAGSAAVGYRTPATQLWQDFNTWAEARGRPAVSIKAFGDSLRRHRILRTKGGDGRILRWPIRFKSPIEQHDADRTRRAAALPANAVRAAFRVGR